MKKLLLAIPLLILGWSSGAQASVLITSFGSGNTNPVATGDLQGSWIGTGTSTSSTFSVSSAASASSGGANGIYSTLGTGKNITGFTGHLQLVGDLTSATPSTNLFVISLYDSSFDELDYDFTWSSFAGGTQTVTASLAASVGTFNGTVATWGLTPTGGPADSSTLSFTFDSLTAVAAPEPSTYAMLGLGLGFLALGFCRRQKNVVRA